jgi:antitoxin component of MazEF toxin-antitoxin module
LLWDIQWIYIEGMTTTLRSWGNSQGIRLPKPLLAALRLESGADVELGLTPKKDAILIKPVTKPRRNRRKVHLEELVAAMPRGYKPVELPSKPAGREAW